MFNNINYDNYDKNIKSFKGAGVITPSLLSNRNNKTDTIKKTFDKNINYTPPLYLTTFDIEPQNTNAYLNPNNYIPKELQINKYYYPTQKLDKVDIIDTKKISKKKLNKINNKNPINFHPPLVTTPPLLNTKSIQKNKEINNKEIDNKEIDNKNYKKIIDTIKDKGWYDNKYIYTFEPTDDTNNTPWRSYKYILPFIKNKTNYYPDNINVLSIPNEIQDNNNKSKNEDNIEDFKNIDNENIDNKNYTISITINSDIIYLIIFTILIIIFFYKSRK